MVSLHGLGRNTKQLCEGRNAEQYGKYSCLPIQRGKNILKLIRILFSEAPQAGDLGLMDMRTASS